MLACTNNVVQRSLQERSSYSINTLAHKEILQCNTKLPSYSTQKLLSPSVLGAQRMKGSDSPVPREPEGETMEVPLLRLLA